MHSPCETYCSSIIVVPPRVYDSIPAPGIRWFIKRISPRPRLLPRALIVGVSPISRLGRQSPVRVDCAVVLDVLRTPHISSPAPADLGHGAHPISLASAGAGTPHVYELVEVGSAAPFGRTFDREHSLGAARSFTWAIIVQIPPPAVAREPIVRPARWTIVIAVLPAVKVLFGLFLFDFLLQLPVFLLAVRHALGPELVCRIRGGRDRPQEDHGRLQAARGGSLVLELIFQLRRLTLVITSRSRAAGGGSRRERVPPPGAERSRPRL